MRGFFFNPDESAQAWMRDDYRGRLGCLVQKAAELGKDPRFSCTEPVILGRDFT